MVLLPTAEKDQPASWLYTTVEPGPGWNARQSTRKADQSGRPGFAWRMPTIPRNTSWNTPAIWMRTSVEVPQLLPDWVYVLRVAHDDDLTVYLNGVKIYQRAGVSLPYGGYRDVVLDEAQAALLREGTNTLAVNVSTSAGLRSRCGFSTLPSNNSGRSRGRRYGVVPTQPRSVQRSLWLIDYLNLFYRQPALLMRFSRLASVAKIQKPRLHASSSAGSQ